MTDSSTTGTRWNGLRRSAFKRKPLPLARQVAWQARTPLKQVSDKRKAENPDYRKFKADLLRRHPMCQVKSPICTGRSEAPHHVIKLSQGGARMPGPLADAQGQVFLAACNACNGIWIENNDHEARRLGFTKSNPLKGQKFYG